VRPEKIRLGPGEVNELAGRVVESAYVGVSTQYVIETAHGRVQVYVQNADPVATGAVAGEEVVLSFAPSSVFVVEPSKEVETP
jgi:spermidine/putrescine transport system ATP-binding protein